MLPKGYFIFLLLAVGLYAQNANSQAALQTKCQHGWSQEYGRCYLAVNYAYPYSKARDYCQKYGARLAVPKGYVISTAVTDLVTQQIPAAAQYRIGYSYPSANSDLATDARGSDDVPTLVDVGLWGRGEPDISAGLCAQVDTTSGLWSMGVCDDLLPFVCEMDPCPAGSRDTFMCNGQCIGQARVCDGTNDCGNDLDEQDCQQPDGICTYTLYENSGTLQWPTSGNIYRTNQNCSWTIISDPGSRMTLSFTSLNTEDMADFVEIYDGSNTLLSADMILRLSGTTTRSLMTSLNFLIVRFVSDSQDNRRGFQMTWTTEHDCRVFEVLRGYKFGNMDGQYDSEQLGSLVTEVKCQTDCYNDNNCFAFSYERASRTCNFINKFPVLVEDGGFDLHVNTCPRGTTVQGSVSVFAGQLTATQAWQQLTTPLYPATYPGNYVQEYEISTPANNLITLQVVVIDLCYGDYVYIYSKSRELLATLGWDSNPQTLVSTGNQVYVRMELKRHARCRGVLLEYKQGCDLVLSGDGVAMSPGYGVPGVNYPPLMLCSWRINAPAADRSITVQFDDFQLGTRDSLTVGYADGSESQYGGQELLGQSITTTDHVTFTMATSSWPSGRGWSASFSPGCTSLNSASYILNHEGSNYGDIVEVRCADGYYFSGSYQGRSLAILTCLRGGNWDNELPICARGFCGPAQSIANGRVDSATGVSGGDMASYVCDAGFDLVNNPDVTCLADNIWGMLPYCTARQCPAISSNAVIHYPVGDGRSQGSVANLTCPEAALELYGPAMVQCNASSWDFISTFSTCQAKRCGVPLIANALFTPALSAGEHYTVGQTLQVQCLEGYDLVGDSLIQCGRENLPSCNVRTCSLDGIDNLAISETFDYGTSVIVSCDQGFELVASTTTTMRVNCQANGAWDNTPACQRKSCGEPYQVKGSTYTYIGNTCYGDGCSFRLDCQDKYELFGASSSGDDIVRCNAGFWDFGDLVCIGGQCPDPGYPPSSILVGDSFQESESITFECTQEGFTPINADGSNFTYITCVYNPFTQSMEWDGDLPECLDTTPPTIVNCPGTKWTLDNVLDYPNFATPYPADNNAVKTFTKEPANIKPNQRLPYGEIWTYTATDYADNTVYCIVRIVIPRTLECRNSDSTNVQLTSFGIQQEIVTRNYIDMYGQINVLPDKERLVLMPNSSLLSYVEEVIMRAYSVEDNTLLAACTLQFRFTALDCATWPLYSPDSMTTSCTGSTCTLRCRSGYYFIDDPATGGEVVMTCSQGVWNRTPPTCAKGLFNYIQYRASYSYGYTMNSGVSDTTVCRDQYQPQVASDLDQFATDMENQCNSVHLPNSGNSFVITREDFSMNFVTTTTPATAAVRFAYFLSMTDLSVSNSQTLLERCADLIQTKLNTGDDTQSLSNIPGNSALGCGQGFFSATGASVTFQNVCEGDRKYFSDQGTSRMCLECPIGKRYDAVENDCVDCADGYYGVAGGCVRCPNGETPGIRGSTSVNDCLLKEICPKGYYSESGLAPCTRCPEHFYNNQEAARTCQACDTNQITNGDAKEASSACLTMAQAAAAGVPTPCDSAPCQNGGVCSIVQHDFFCTCPADATGERCEVTLTACSSNPCKNGQRCFPDNLVDFTCECNLNPSQVDELSGDLCEIDRYGCQGDICLNNGTCHNQLQNFRCKCPTHGGYKNIGICNTAIDQCVDNPCSNGAACVAHGTYYRSCDCLPGYEGLNCTQDKDDCSPNPCRNGAACTDGLNSFSCQCLQGYHGNRCQFRTACDRECSAGVTTNCHQCSMATTESCNNVGNSYTCNCAPGYTGASCDVLISPCHSYPCKAGGECIHVSANQYRCVCQAPWTGDRCETQMDNCPAGNNQCHNGGTCYSTPEGYVCQCPHNYIGQDCSEPYDICARLNPCLAGGICSLDQDGNILCDCPLGYDGDYCEIVLPTCSTTTPCANGGTCTDTSSGVSCQCVPGFRGDRCEVNIDECAGTTSCSAVQECIDGVNQYTCICAPGHWGDNCDKEVGMNFDYIIPARAMARGEASSFIFGDGVTPISALTVSFWLRYTTVIGEGVSLNIYGSNAGDDLIPVTPDFQLTFDLTGVFTFVKDDARRKKRATETLSYTTLEGPVNVADGFWHHVVVAWSDNPGEIDLYVDNILRDQVRFAQGQTVGTSGFVVFGDFDVVSGTTDPSNSFSGKVSQLYILDYKVDNNTINDLYSRTASLDNLLSHERTLMLYYPVFYNSELATGFCLPSNSTCQGLNPGSSVPSVDSCPADVLVYTERGGRPVWPVPTFSNAIGAPFYNYENNSTMDWGVYGIGYAAFDATGSAGVCFFTLFNYRGQALPCNIRQGGDAPSSVNVAGGRRYSPQCASGEAIAGNVPVYQSCSMYSMWGQEITANYQYQYPVCAATSSLTAHAALTLDLEVTGWSAFTCNDYMTYVIGSLSDLNNDLGGKLCPANCFSPVSAAISCTGPFGDTARVDLDLGLIDTSLTYQGRTVTIEEVLRLAVGDRQVFTYTDNGAGVTVHPMLSSVDISSDIRCADGYEAQGDKCVECGAGTYYADGMCHRCEVGQYRVENSPDYTSCESCHVSQTTVSDGSTSDIYCKEQCIPGKYNDITFNRCQDCPVGFYTGRVGAFFCEPCNYTTTTTQVGANSPALCIDPPRPTDPPGQPNVGAATEDTGLGVGAIVAVVLSLFIIITIVLLIVCFCCCKDNLPCFGSKKKQTVGPTGKEGYYANKYGKTNMQFVSYNLHDVREKKGRPLDRQPIVEHPPSDETASNISVHVPVFNEKLDGKVSKKNLYMSNGGQNLNTSRTRSMMSSHEPTPRTYEHPITSSPRGTRYDEVEEDVDAERKHRSKRRRRRHRKERSGERSHRSAERTHRHTQEPLNRSHSEERAENHYDEIHMSPSHGQIPKALAPMPHRIKSMPPSDIHIRPLSPLERPRAQVNPNEYQDFLVGSPKRTPKGTPQRSSQRSANFMDTYNSDGPEETPIHRIVVDSSEEDQR